MRRVGLADSHHRNAPVSLLRVVSDDSLDEKVLLKPNAGLVSYGRKTVIVFLAK